MFLDFFVDDSLLKKEARKCYLVKLFIKTRQKTLNKKSNNKTKKVKKVIMEIK
jgi:hypothetical protein